MTFKNYVGKRVSLFLNIINIILSILFPYKFVRYFDINPFLNYFFLVNFLTLTFKLASYVHVMSDLKMVYD